MWNEIASPTACNFTKNGKFYLNFLLMFLFPTNVKISIWTFLLYKKNSVKKYIYSKFQRAVISYWLVVWISFLSCFEIFKWTFSKMYFGQHKVKIMTIQTLKVAWNESLYFMLTKNVWTTFENRTGHLKIAHFHEKSLYFLYENDTLEHCLSFDLR